METRGSVPVGKANGGTEKSRKSPKFCIQHVPSEEEEVVQGHHHRQSLFIKFINQTFSTLSGPSAPSDAMESHFERYLKKHINKCADDFDVRLRMMEQRIMGRLDLLSDKVLDMETRMFHLETDKRLSCRLSQNGLTPSDVTSSISLSDRKNLVPSPNAIFGVNPSRETTPSPTPNDFTDFLAMSPKIMHYGDFYSPLTTPMGSRRRPRRRSSPSPHEPSVAPSSEDEERVLVRSLSASPVSRSSLGQQESCRTKSFRIPRSGSGASSGVDVTASELLAKLAQAGATSSGSGGSHSDTPGGRRTALRRIETLQNDENEELDAAKADGEQGEGQGQTQTEGEDQGQNKTQGQEEGDTSGTENPGDEELDFGREGQHWLMSKGLWSSMYTKAGLAVSLMKYNIMLASRKIYLYL